VKLLIKFLKYERKIKRQKILKRSRLLWEEEVFENRYLTLVRNSKNASVPPVPTHVVFVLFFFVTDYKVFVEFLADRTNGRAYATVLCLSVICL